MLRQTSRRPCIEPLESRCLLSAFAPASLTGKRIDFLDGSQVQMLAGNRFRYVDPQGLDTGGPYICSYVKTGSSSAVLTLNLPGNDPGYAPEPYMSQRSMQFTSKSEGAIEGSSGGSFIIEDGSRPAAPAKFGGLHLFCTNGNSGDTFELRTSANGSYTLHVLSGSSQYITDQVGTFTYQKTGPATADLSAYPGGNSIRMVGSRSGWLYLTGEYGYGINAAFTIEGSVGSAGKASPQPEPGRLSGSIANHIAANVMADGMGTALVQLTNSNAFPVSGPYTVAVAVGSVNSDGSLGLQTPLAHVVLAGAIRQGKTKVTIRFHYGVPIGVYKLILAGGPVSNQWQWIQVATATTAVR